MAQRTLSSITPPSIPVVLVGDYGVGKTALFRRFTLGTWDDYLGPRLEMERREAQANGLDIATGGQALLNFVVVGTEGVERFAHPTKYFYRGVKGVALVYDVTNADSFRHLTTWYEEATQLCAASEQNAAQLAPAFVLVGAKMDLCANKEDAMAVSRQDAETFARAHGDMPLVLTSAKTDSRVRDAFNALANQILRRPELLEGHSYPVVFAICGNNGERKRSFCCAF